jgi:PAS domain S-box-containing protein
MKELSKLTKQQLLDYIQNGGYDKRSYFDLVEEAPYAIFIHDFGTIVYLNKKGLEIIEEEKKEAVLNKNLFYLFENEKKENIDDRLNKILKNEQQPDRQAILKLKNGKRKTLHLKSSKFEFFGRSCVQTFATDITEQEETKKKLEETQYYFKVLADNTEDVVFRMEVVPKRKYTFISPSIEKLTGYKPEEFYENPQLFVDIIHPDNPKIDTEQFIREIFSKPYTVKWKTKSGDAIWTETVNTPIYENGELKVVYGVSRDITEWIKNKEEIINQRESYKNLLQKSPLGILIHDGQKALYANDFILKLISAKSFNEVEVKDIFSYILPEYHEQVKQRITQQQQGKDTPFFEFKGILPNKTIIDLEIKSVPVLFEGKQAFQIIINDPGTKKQLEKEIVRAATAEDLNKKLEREIKQKLDAEKKLIESKIFVENIINSSLDMIVAVDNENRITEFNKAAQKTFGYTKKEILGKKADILFADIQQYNLSNVVIEETEGFFGEIKNKRKDGTLFTSLVTTSTIKNEKGEKIGSMGLSRDISDIKNTQEKLFSQSAKLNLIFQNSSHIIFTVDKNFKLTSFNNNFIALQEAALGVTPKIGTTVIINSGVIYSNEVVKHRTEIHKKAIQGISSVFENELTKKNGEKIWLETYVDPIVLENNQIEEATYIVHDITEKKQAEQLIKEALKEKEILLKEVHHRVKNNLQIISSIINLQSTFVKDESSQDMLKDIQNRIKTMSFIHESLYQTKDFSSINFAEYVQNLAQNLTHSYRLYDKKIEIKVIAKPIFLNLDQSIPCGLIINELVTNAFKYAFKNKNEGEINISITQQNQTVFVIVEDNGLGFPKEIDFKNTESLGLQLVVTLTEQLSGKIELETKKGTKFILSFTNNLKNNNNE